MLFLVCFVSTAANSIFYIFARNTIGGPYKNKRGKMIFSTMASFFSSNHKAHPVCTIFWRFRGTLRSQVRVPLQPAIFGFAFHQRGEGSKRLRYIQSFDLVSELYFVLLRRWRFKTITPFCPSMPYPNIPR